MHAEREFVTANQSLDGLVAFGLHQVIPIERLDEIELAPLQPWIEPLIGEVGNHGLALAMGISADPMAVP